MRTGSHPDHADSRTTAMKAVNMFRHKLPQMRVVTKGIPQWNRGYSPKAGYMSVDEMKEKMLDTVFTIAPPGNSPESFRLFEAIACGSIPVVVRNDTRMPDRYGDRMAPFIRSNAPFAWVDDYSNLAEWLEEATHKWESGGFDGQHAALMKWWAKFETDVYRAVADGIKGVRHVPE